jgi:hypothetical protein
MLPVREDEAAYYLRRAAEELRLAEHTTCPEAAEAHREMHRWYVAIVQGSRKTAPEKPDSVEAASD